MTTNWSALTPHIPVRPGANEYIGRKGSVSEEITNWILAGRSVVLLGGPTGVGKSTELAQAAQQLQKHRVACLIPLDRSENMRRITADRLLQRIASRVAYLAKEHLRLPLSPELFEESQAAASNRWSAPVLAQLVLTEVARLSQQGRVTLLLDGLEKVPEGAGSLDLFDTLAALPDVVEMVVVIPWHATFGPHAETIVRAGERFVPARALLVDDERGHDGRLFLQNVLRRRLSPKNEVRDPDPASQDRDFSQIQDGDRLIGAAESDLVDDAARASGGLPRMFLQLMADAASHAKLRDQSDWPTADDLDEARQDQADTFRRLLLPGDADAAKAAVGSDGRELDLSRKIRLMAHGILLERLHEQVPVLEIHPLARIAIMGKSRRA